MNKKKSTKNQIIEAAYNCFSEKGYLGTTTKEIAKAAKVSEITIFRHFGSKESIFESVLRYYSIIPDLQKINFDFEMEKLSISEILQEIGERLYFTFVNKKKFLKIMFSEITQYSDKIFEIHENFIDEVDNLLVNILLKKEKNLQFKDIDLKIAVKGFIGMIFSYFLTENIIKGNIISEEKTVKIIETFVKIFLNGIMV